MSHTAAGVAVSELDFAWNGDDLDYDPDTAPLHYMPLRLGKHYAPHTCATIQYMYMVAAIIWMVLIYSISFWKSGPFGWLFLIIPLFIYGINLANVNKHTVDVEDDMFQGNFLSFGYLVVLFIINWEKVKEKRRLLTILAIALVLILFSMYDLWLPKRKIIYVKHFRSICIVAALSLLAYALFIYYEGILYYGNSKECPEVSSDTPSASQKESEKPETKNQTVEKT